MKGTQAPSANGRPAAKAKTPPRKKGPAARPAPARIDAATVERLADYRDALKRMQRCRGCRQIQRIVTQAHAFRALIADTIENYGPGSGGATDVFLRDFHMEKGHVRVRLGRPARADRGPEPEGGRAVQRHPRHQVGHATAPPPGRRRGLWVVKAGVPTTEAKRSAGRAGVTAGLARLTEPRHGFTSEDGR